MDTDNMTNMTNLRQKVARSRLAAAAAAPGRVSLVGRHNAASLRRSMEWLVRSREHTNLTYELTTINRAHLAWFIAALADRPVGEIQSYIDEIHSDQGLRDHVQRARANSEQRRLADGDLRLGRRAGWYALVRALRPAHIVETGTDKGLGTCVLAAAVLRNSMGRVTTIDVNPASGYLINGPYANVIDRRIGDSASVLEGLDEVNLFLHDSLHSYAHETAELAAVEPHLGDHAMVLSDNAHCTDALADWAERTGRRFLFFREQPRDHWYPGAGIGAAWDRL